jgi:general transcription factor 3C polypeptide 5 (transcription factor C subunit 1)
MEPMDDGQRLAPRVEIPRVPLIAIEHPCVVKNLDKGIKSLGGTLDLDRVSCKALPLIL